MQENFSRVLNEFGDSLGLPGLALDEGGYCGLRFDDIPVHLELLGERQQVLLHTCLGSVPAQADKAFHARLLHGNHFFAGTAGATIGVHPESGSIDMALVLEGERLTLEGFERALKAFVDMAEAWQRELAGGHQPEAEDATSAQVLPRDWSSLRA
jgi:hypothetical protein